MSPAINVEMSTTKTSEATDAFVDQTYDTGSAGIFTVLSIGLIFQDT